MHISGLSLNPYADEKNKSLSLKEQNFEGELGRSLVYCAECKEFGCKDKGYTTQVHILEG